MSAAVGVPSGSGLGGGPILDIHTPACHRLPIQGFIVAIEAQWRSSPDLVRWSPWRHLCWLDSEKLPAFVVSPEEWWDWLQVRYRRDEGEWRTSPIYPWDEHEVIKKGGPSS